MTQNSLEREVERALSVIPGFSAARIRGQLSDGPTNASFLLEQGAFQYVLRVDKPAAVRLGLDRQNEMQVWIAAAEAGLTPEPLYFDPVAGHCLRRYLRGRRWSESDLGDREKLTQLAAMLSKLHGIECKAERFEPLRAARRYASELETEQALAILRRAERLMDQDQQPQAGHAVCHNDLVCGNILQGKRLYLIDWEYAGAGDSFFDLATVAQHHHFEADRARFFLDSYFGRAASEREWRQFNRQRGFYQCLLDLWNLRVSGIE
jgi:thiamine kinase-like enzyme